MFTFVFLILFILISLFIFRTLACIIKLIFVPNIFLSNYNWFPNNHHLMHELQNQIFLNNILVQQIHDQINQQIYNQIDHLTTLNDINHNFYNI